MIHTVARGTVIGEPVTLQTDQGTTTVFILAPHALSALASPEAGPWPAACEVWCREARLAAASLYLHNRQLVVILGKLWLEPLTGPLEDDLSGVRVHIEATTVGLELPT
jgi:hypothetical protein